MAEASPDSQLASGEQGREKLAHHEGRRRILKHTDKGATPLAIAGLAVLAFLIAACAFWSVLLVVRDVTYRIEYETAGQAPLWVFGAFAYTATAFALGMVGDKILLRVRGWRIRRLMPRYPDEPWRWDYRWNPRTVRVSGAGFQLAGLLGMTVLIAFFSLFNLAAWDTWDPRFIILAALGDALLLYVLVRLVLNIWRRLSQTLTASVRLARFPFFLGEQMEIELRGPRFRGPRAWRITLRQIEESYKGVFQVYAERRTVETSERPIRLVFPLPADGVPNRLTEFPHRYWELDVTRPGQRRGMVFLLPVYARPNR